MSPTRALAPAFVAFGALGLGCVPTAASIRASIDASAAEGQAFAEAIQYRRWGDAVDRAERRCAAVEQKPEDYGQRAQARQLCLSWRIQAYSGRARAQADKGDFDQALTDQRLVSAAVGDLPVANSQYDAYLRTTVPKLSADSIVKMEASEAQRLTAQAAYRTSCYGAHRLPTDPYADNGQSPPGGMPAPPPPPPPATVTVQPAAVTATLATGLRAAPQLGAYAWIIGIGHYRDLPEATGGREDAERFYRLAHLTLGIPEDHIRVALDDRATRSDLESGLGWLAQSVPSGSRLYVFFSGHGAPEAADGSGTPYLIPYDGNPQELSRSALRLSDVLGQLAQTKARDVLVFVDSCFSGLGPRSVMAAGARPLLPVAAVGLPSKVVLFSASGPSQTTGPAPGERQGLFSKYLLEALETGEADENGDGQISAAELMAWVKPRVERVAREAQREQSPGLGSGAALTPTEVSVSWGYPTK